MAITRVLGATAVAATLPTTVGGTGATTFSPGKVLQVVTGTTDVTVTQTTSYADTGLTASITPASTSNKIFVIVTQTIFWSTNGLSIKIMRDTTDLFLQPINYVVHNTGASNNRSIYPIQYLDSPSSTSSLVYKTQCILHSSGTIETQEANAKSYITLMEIAG